MAAAPPLPAPAVLAPVPDEPAAGVVVPETDEADVLVSVPRKSSAVNLCWCCWRSLLVASARAETLVDWSLFGLVQVVERVLWST